MQGKSSCQHTKIFGHSFLCTFKNSVNVESFIKIFAHQEKVDLCTWHYDKKKKNAPHFLYLKLAVNFSFLERSLKRLSVAEWNGKNSSFFQWINAKGNIFLVFVSRYNIRIPTMILFWFQSDWIIMQQVPVSNIIMSTKSPKRSIVKNGFFGYFIKQFFREIVDRVTECVGHRGWMILHRT